jgi:hypothetical protein
MEWEEFFPVVQFDKSTWSVIDVSDETAWDGGGKDVIIDGIIANNNYWHSQWSPSEAPLPHWAIIDMVSAPQTITKTESYRSATTTKTVQYFVSNDPNPNATSWVKIMEGTFGSGNPLTINATTNIITGRYLKIFLPNSNWNQLINVVEINVFGVK